MPTSVRIFYLCFLPLKRTAVNRSVSPSVCVQGFIQRGRAGIVPPTKPQSPTPPQYTVCVSVCVCVQGFKNLYSLILCMTLWQCPTNFFPPTKKSCMKLWCVCAGTIVSVVCCRRSSTCWPRAVCTLREMTVSSSACLTSSHYYWYTHCIDTCHYREYCCYLE